MCCYDLKERREQTTDIVDAMNKIYRCITPKLPTAKNALFRRDVDGKLKFMEWKWDDVECSWNKPFVCGKNIY